MYFCNPYKTTSRCEQIPDKPRVIQYRLRKMTDSEFAFFFSVDFFCWYLFFRWLPWPLRKSFLPKKIGASQRKPSNVSQSLQAWMFVSMQLRLVSSSWRSYFVPLLWAPLVRETLKRGLFWGGWWPWQKWVSQSELSRYIGVIYIPHFCGRIKQYKSLVIQSDLFWGWWFVTF